MWSVAEISFEMVDDVTDDPVVTVVVSTPAGPVTFKGEPVLRGTTLLLRGTHVQGLSANIVGTGNLMMIARAVMEGMGWTRR